MKKVLIVCSSILFVSFAAVSQSKFPGISKREVLKIESVLSNDSMQGRRTFTPGIKKAAAFISNEFEKAGLQKWPGLDGFFQQFDMIAVQPESVSIKGEGRHLTAENLIEISTRKKIKWSDKSRVKVDSVSNQQELMQKFRKYMNPEKNAVVWVNNDLEKTFNRLKKYLSGKNNFEGTPTVLFILADKPLQKFKIRLKNKLTKMTTSNVVGYLPGKSRPEEYVVFSAHYDHLGIYRSDGSKPSDRDKDTIYNGANDDASGTTAVIALAHYFSRKKDNARSLIFVAFTGEELGGYGSHYFSKQLDPDKVAAMFNIEMIGTPSKWGENSAYITGYQYSDFGKILQKNLTNSRFSFYPDPYPKQQLFYRSDNATLARLGVPAHTISTSQMDKEPHYHKVSDEIGTLDIENMVRIIRGIAISSQSIVNGMDTPTRVEPKKLK